MRLGESTTPQTVTAQHTGAVSIGVTYWEHITFDERVTDTRRHAARRCRAGLRGVVLGGCALARNHKAANAALDLGPADKVER